MAAKTKQATEPDLAARRRAVQAKAGRKDAQDTRARLNKDTRRGGGKTPWQEAKAARYARRHPAKA
jgi:hypothetical protein